MALIMANIEQVRKLLGEEIIHPTIIRYNPYYYYFLYIRILFSYLVLVIILLFGYCCLYILFFINCESLCNNQWK